MVDDSKNSGKATAASSTTVGSATVGNDTNLETYLAEHGPMPWRQCLAQLHDICFDLEKSSDHSRIGELSIRSFIVKKDNTEYGITIKLASVDLPVDENSLRRSSGFSFPSEAYMSPERCCEKTVDQRADIYTLGCVMYQMLTGSPPFTHRAKDKLKEAQSIEYALPPGRRSRSYIPDEVDLLIERCLEKDPTKRFRRPSELRAAIGKVLQLEEDPEDQIIRSPKFKEFFAKKRRVFALVAGAVAFTAVLGYISLSTTSSDSFINLIEKSAERKRNKWFLNLEHGPAYLAQADFGNGKMEPDKGKIPLILKVHDADLMLYGTTRQTTVKDALEEAIRRRLIMFKVNLAGADLKGATIAGGSLPGVFAVEANLEGADLSGCQMKEGNFYGSNLKGAKMSAANAEGASFQKANLEGAVLSNAVLLNCDFKDANLKNADLSNCYFLAARFDGADLTGAKLNGATVTDECAMSQGLTPEQLNSLKIVPGPKDTRRGVRLTAPRGGNQGSGAEQQPLGQNPFTRSIDSIYGIPADAPIGLQLPKPKPGEPIPIKDLPRKKPGTVPVTPAAPKGAPGLPVPESQEPNRPRPAY